jgi:transketolase
LTPRAGSSINTVFPKTEIFQTDHLVELDMGRSFGELDEKCVTTIRMLAVDQVEQAKSGHPGMPLGAAPMAYVLWDSFLRFSPRHPQWPNRDRFILSAGHGSALQYALLHLYGYDLSLDELKNFRQWGSKTPGHPEYGPTPGVEATTGPLGQGFAMGVGMALAERFLSGKFNRPGLPVIDHFTYAIVSDGDLMEGVASEAASLAGTLGLGKIIYLYDDNHISIEGKTDLTFTEDRAGRFAAYGWQVIKVKNGNDLAAIHAAIQEAQADLERPSLIQITTHIGFGTPKQDQASAHGEPLGAEAWAAAREFYKWPPNERFVVPDDVREHMGRAKGRGQGLQDDWQSLMGEYRRKNQSEAAELERMLSGELPADFRADVPAFEPNDGPIATRAASGKVLNALAGRVPELIGGSADLAPSNKTFLAGYDDLRTAGPKSRNVHFGVREHAMGAVVNGLALHGGVRPYGGTFLVFADYMRPAIRLAALMDIPSTFVFTHDSIGVGEDGPTHQPVEQAMALRVIPNLCVIRPADAGETAGAWRVALERKGPTALLLSRQKLPVLDPARFDTAAGVARGGYVLVGGADRPDLILIASGSEVHLALAAAETLGEQGRKVRLVSLPSFELFEAQPRAYREEILPPFVTARLAIEAGVTWGWERYVGDRGDVVGLDRFGASAPGGVVFQHLGFTVDQVVARALALLT